jgi:hypothetical protein
MASPGFESKAGLQREPIVFSKVWPSTSLRVIDALLPLLNEDVDLEQDQVLSSRTTNRAALAAPVVTSQRVRGPIAFNVLYEGLEFIWAMILGFQARAINGTTIPEDLDGVAFRHLYEVDEVLDAQPWRSGDGFTCGTIANGGSGLICGQRKMRRATWAIDKVFNIWEARSVMVDAMQLQASNANVLMQLATVGHSIDYDAQINTNIANVACDKDPRVLWPHCRVLLAPFNETTPLDDDNEISDLTGVQLSINNSLRANPTRDTRKEIDEPRRRGSVVISGSVAAGVFNDNNSPIQNFNQVQTELMMIIEFIGAQIPGSAEFYTLRLYFPTIRMTGHNNPTQGAGQRRPSFTFAAYKPSVQPAGFPASIKNGPIMVELINTVQAHPLL